MGLTLAAVRNGRLDLTRTKRIDVDPMTNRVVREGNFYIVRGNGRLSLVGRAGLAPNAEAPVVFPDLLIEANFDPSRVNPRFFRLVWDSIEVRADIESRARTAAGIYKINLANLAEVRVPMPSVHEQLGIADLLDEQLRAIEAISEALEVQRGAIEALREAVLRQAFDGVAA
jgi:type I restriction enzyme S subunit